MDAGKRVASGLYLNLIQAFDEQNFLYGFGLPGLPHDDRLLELRHSALYEFCG